MKFLLFIILSFFVVIAAVFVFFFLPQKVAQPPIQDTALPTKIPTPIVQVTLPAENNIAPITKNDIIKQLPIIVSEYNIEYFTTTDTFIVTIKESPYEGNKQKAIDWFTNLGITDPTKLRLIYTKYRWVQ